MAEPAITLAALAIEAATGYPRALYRRIGHPVDWVAALVAGLERHWNRPERPPSGRRAAGIAMIALLVGGVGGIAWVAQWMVITPLGSPVGVVSVAVIASAGLAQRSLHEHVAAVARPLEAGRLDEARAAVALIVGRDTAGLSASGVARAGIESLAESFCDGVVAPAFWLLAGGLPGLFVYKAVNTADSLVGHKEARWRAFGWAAARSDDLMNLPPARIAGALICVAGSGGWRTMATQAARHASPNAGWPEAAMAGALGVELGGRVAYDGVPADRPLFGDGGAAPDAAALRRALRLYRRACALLWLLVGGLLWAL